MLGDGSACVLRFVAGKTSRACFVVFLMLDLFFVLCVCVCKTNILGYIIIGWHIIAIFLFLGHDGLNVHTKYT